MKYRIVELHNGKFQVQHKRYLFAEWEPHYGIYSTLSEAEQFMEFRIKEHRLDEGHKVKTVRKVYNI